MAYDGWFNFGGTEIINVARLRAYQESMNIHWFRPGYTDSQYIGPMLDETYIYPWTDAPWYDANNPDSSDFYGVYPLNVQGLEDSTRTATVTESILDGGVVGRLRNGTRSIVFEAAILAATTCGAEYGMNWLKAALNGGSSNTCAGDSLCFFSCAPFYDATSGNASGSGGQEIVRANWDGGYWIYGTDQSNNDPLDGGDTNDVYVVNYDGGSPSVTGGILSPPYSPPFLPDQISPPPFSPSDCLPEFERHFRNVAFTQGPTVTKKKELTNGNVVWTVTFTAVAGIPFAFGAPRTIIDNYLGPNPIWGVPGGFTDAGAETITDVACLPTAWEPLVDPLCPAIIAPPSVPDIGLGCFDPPDTWTRRWFTIPEDQIPVWGDVVPLLDVAATFAEVRNLRVRFYTDDGSHVVTETCNPIADFVFSYIPFTYTITLDAEQRIVYATDQQGQQKRADSVVFASDSAPFEWPILSCGGGLIVTLDVPNDSATVPEVSLSLVSRGA